MLIYEFLLQALMPMLFALLCQLIISTGITEALTSFRPLPLTLSDYDVAEVFLGGQDEYGDVMDIYAGLARGQGAEVNRAPDGNVTALILEEGEKDIRVYMNTFVEGAEFARNDSADVNTANAIFNTVPYHSAPTALNLVSNTLLRHLLGPDAGGSDYGISVTTHPLDSSSETAEQLSIASFLYATYIPLGLSLVITAFIIFPLTERVTNAKQVQIMTGISGATYWLSNFIFDMAVFMVSGLLMLGVLIGLDDLNIFLGAEAIGATVLLLLLYGLAGTAMSYFFSFLLKSSTAGFSLVFTINFVAGTSLI